MSEISFLDRCGGCRITKVATPDGAVMDRTESTIDLTLNAAGLRLLLARALHDSASWKED